MSPGGTAEIHKKTCLQKPQKWQQKLWQANERAVPKRLHKIMIYTTNKTTAMKAIKIEITDPSQLRKGG